MALFGRRASVPVDETAIALRRILWRTLAIGLGGFAVVVLAADVSRVHERYLTPLLMVLPPLAALQLAGWGGRRWFVVAGAATFAAVLVGLPVLALKGTHHFSRPYDALTEPLTTKITAGPVAVSSNRQDLAANTVLALQRKGIAAAIAGDRLAPTPVTFVWVRWSGLGWPADEPSVPPEFCPHAVVRAEEPLANWTGSTMVLTGVVASSCDGAPHAVPALSIN
jgi:hypothetical protein